MLNFFDAGRRFKTANIFSDRLAVVEQSDTRYTAAGIFGDNFYSDDPVADIRRFFVFGNQRSILTVMV
ncbi:MAG TPA: hypothetical protein PKO47_12030 [bacterium]|nr:hypothetical protein [bacterium]